MHGFEENPSGGRVPGSRAWLELWGRRAAPNEAAPALLNATLARDVVVGRAGLRRHRVALSFDERDPVNQP